MRSVSASNFRCFGTEQKVDLSPFTLFVGENSTGKSSLMALIGVLWKAHFSRLPRPDFNQEPFDLGGFHDMVHYRGGRGGRRTNFTATMVLGDKLGKSQGLEATATFRDRDGYPQIQSYAYALNGFSIKVCIDSKFATFTYQGTDASPHFTHEIDLSDEALSVEQYPLNLFFWHKFLDEIKERFKERFKFPDSFPDIMDTIDSILKRDGFNFAFMAPLRARPERIYLLGSSMIDPEAHNLPNYLMTIKYTNPSHWKQLKAGIETFGRYLGLFSQFDVVAMANGKGIGPFEMRVKGNPNQPRPVGPWRNLVDVGYGVSQILPLVCRLSDPSVRLHLIQQPEIHLHPKAQAALGSFLCEWVAEGRGQVIVETHSQYLLDRVRMEVRDSRIDIGSADVSVAFFESRGLESKIASIGFDHSGNVRGAPPGYNSFFVDEVTRSLGL